MLRFLLLGIVGAALVGCTATPIPIPYDEFRVPLGENVPGDPGFWIDVGDTWHSNTDADVPPEDGPDTTEGPVHSDGPSPDIPDAGDGSLPDIPDAGPSDLDAGADAGDGSTEAG